MSTKPETTHTTGFAQDEPLELEALSITGESAEDQRKESEESLGIQYNQALPMQRLAEELVKRRQGGLGETLAGMPGVHMDSFGGGASRPVIRGQTMPWIAVLSDGMTIHDVSSISPDHAIAADPLLLDEIEVIRGPATTIYGGNALNCAINLIDGKIPKKLPKNGITGAGEVRYGTGDNEKTARGSRDHRYWPACAACRGDAPYRRRLRCAWGLRCPFAEGLLLAQLQHGYRRVLDY